MELLNKKTNIMIFGCNNCNRNNNKSFSKYKTSDQGIASDFVVEFHIYQWVTDGYRPWYKFSGKDFHWIFFPVFVLLFFCHHEHQISKYTFWTDPRKHLN